MALTARTFRVFVSSTFEDFVEERDVLQQRVFPALTEFCRARGANFQAIDLRWGVSEQASVDHRAIDICLAEIDRCKAVSPRPNFIILLGDRYGWCPPPREIPADAFAPIAYRVASVGDRELLDHWYGRDDNAVPPVRYLRPRHGELREYEAWEPIERRLRRILEEAVAGIEWADDPRFVSSATEQEIVAGALTVPDARDHVFCFLRSITDDDGAARLSAIADERLARLKSRVGAALPTGVWEYGTSRRDGRPDGEYLNQLADDVLAALTRVIDSELDLLEHEDALVQEAARHREFGAERASDFTGRDWALARIAVHLEQELGGLPSHPFVIHGASGAGKSALLARAAIDAERDHPNAVTLTRFLGCTPESTSGRDLLDGLCRQIVRAYSAAPELVAENRRELLDETTLPHDYNDLVREFPNRIGLASAERPLHIFLDALDQLPPTDSAHRLGWLPSQLPEHVRIVASTTASSVTYRILEARLPSGELAALDRMDQADGEHLLEMWLARAGRTLTPAQHAHLIERFELEGLPWYLKLAFEQARRWRSDDQPQLAIGIAGVIRTNLLARLAAEEEHGATLVAHSLGYLAAARNGLSEDELLELLSADGEVLAEFRRRSPRSPVVDRLPPIVWTRLYFDLEPYLTERVADGSRLLTFYHRQLREVIEEDYLAGEEGVRRHRQLAKYFGDDTVQPLQRGANGAGDGVANLRRLSELPYQQTQARMTDAVTATLTDIAFLTAKAEHAGTVEIGGGDEGSKVAYVGVYQLQVDYALALSKLPGLDGVVEEFRDALDREVHNLVAEPELLFQQLYNRLQWTTGRARDVMERERTRRSTPFMHTLTRVRESAALRRTLAADSDCVNHVAAIPGSGLIVSAGYDNELKIWDPRTGELINLLVGHTDTVEICEPTPDGSRLVSLSRDQTVRIWDLATGANLHTLPGHDDAHYIGSFTCAVSSDGHFAVVPAKGGRGAFNVWDIDDGALISRFDGYGKQCLSWALAPDASTVAAGFLSGRKVQLGVRIAPAATDVTNDAAPDLPDDSSAGLSGGRLVTWNPLDGRMIATAATAGDEVRQVAFSSDGARVITETLSNLTGPSDQLELRITVECWDSRTLEPLWSHERRSSGYVGHPFSVGADAISVDGGGDSVIVVDRGGEPVTSYPGRPGKLSPDGTTLVSVGGAPSLTVWEARTFRRLGDLVGHGGAIQNWVFTDGGFIATSCDDGTIPIWDLSKLRPDDDLPGHAGPVTATRIRPDGAVVVSAGHANTDDPHSVKLWSSADGGLLRAIDAHSGERAYSALWTDRNDLVTGGMDDVAFWRGDDGRLSGRWRGQVILRLASTERGWVLGCGWDNDLTVFDAKRAEAIMTVPAESQVLRVALTPDNQIVVGGRRDGLIQTWNVADWSCRELVLAHGVEREVVNEASFGYVTSYPPITAVAVSPDSRNAVSAGRDGTIRIWELAAVTQSRVLTHPASVWACAYTPDGEAIVSSAGDGSIWVWDAHGASPGRLLARAAPANFCVVTPDGRLVITAHADRSTSVRELATGRVVASIHTAGSSTCFELHPWRPFLTCGDQAGNVSLIEIPGLEYGPIVVTARERPESAGLFVRCPRCQLEHRVDPAELGGEHRCPTPGCALPLRVNAFFSSSARVAIRPDMVELWREDNRPHARGASDTESVDGWVGSAAAERALIDALCLNPDQVGKAAFDFAELLEEEGDVAGAAEAYRLVIDSDDSNYGSKAAVSLAWLCHKQGDVAGAAAAYQLAIDSGHPSNAPEAAYRLGVLRLEHGDTAGAAAALQIAIDLGNPVGIAVTAYLLAIAREQLGDVAGAAAAYHLVVNSDDENLASQAAEKLRRLRAR
jgi:WD40 repeat protein